MKWDGSVVTWWNSFYGWDVGSAAASLTSGVVDIVGNGYSLVALKSDGSVAAWWFALKGWDTSSVSSQLNCN
jgi:hypothetical protein